MLDASGFPGKLLKKPGLEALDRYLQMHCSNLWYQSALPGLASGMGALILSRKLWYDSQAFIEI